MTEQHRSENPWDRAGLERYVEEEERPAGTKLVLMSDELFAALGADRIEWGEPDEHGWYTPTLYCDDRLPARLRRLLRWVGLR